MWPEQGVLNSYMVDSCMGHSMLMLMLTFTCYNPRSALMQGTHCLWQDPGMQNSDVSLVSKRQLCLPSGQQRWLHSHSCL